MAELICTVFDVEHGFCAFVRSPNGYGLLLDCGSRGRFSPIKWIRQRYNSAAQNILYFKGRRFAKGIITHLHADHFDDVGSLRGTEEPKILLRDKKTLHFVDEKIQEGSGTKEGKRKLKALKAFKKFSEKFTEDVDDNVPWGLDFFRTRQIAYNEAERASDGRERIINNRSFLTAISFAGKKILIPGDIEVPGWEIALEKEATQKIVANTTFFVASHHGHKSGFTSKILAHSSVPDIYIVSAKKGDEQVDSSYSNKAYSRGYVIDGDTRPSRMVSTRERGKSIEITIRDDGSTKIGLLASKDNLTPHQAALRDKHTQRAVKGWKVK